MKSLILLSALILLAGCGPQPYVQGRNDVPGPPPQLQFASERLRNDIQVGKLVFTRDQADILSVTVPLHSISEKSYSIDWRVTWLDGQGRPMGPTTGWSQKTMTTNINLFIQTNAMQPGAKDFQMDLRRSE